MLVAARPHFASLMSIEGDNRARRGSRAVDPNRKQPLLDQASVFGARRQLLADIAALVPIDPIQFIEPGFEQDRLVERRGRGCRREHRERGAAGRIRRNRSRSRRPNSIPGESARAERIARAPSAVRRGSMKMTPLPSARAAPGLPAKPERRTAEQAATARSGRSSSVDLGAQPVDRQPPLQVAEARRLGIDPDRIAMFATMKNRADICPARSAAPRRPRARY